MRVCKFKGIIFTVIPPPVDWEGEKVKRKAFEIVSISNMLNIRTINIPEVIEEKDGKGRVVPYKPKVDNVEFGKILKGFDGNLDIIIDKVVPLIPKDLLEDTLLSISKEFKGITLVGGESSKKVYPGFSPLEAVGFARGLFSKVYGITIFTRKNEAERLLAKTKAGFNAFISQIVFETENMRKVLKEYYKLCNSEGIKPATIYISLAPASKKKDIEFMEWLGVYIPEDIKRYLLEDEGLIEKRSIEIVERLALDVSTTEGELGINVEHVMYNNLQVAGYTLHRIKEVCGWK
ncbi:MAG: mycobacterial-type methylenetetrahydrofolate reductase [candidate division WOR-3 bacterium]